MLALYLATAIVLLICITYGYEYGLIAAIPLTGYLLYFSYSDKQRNIIGAGWICDATSGEYQERCHEDKFIIGYKTKPICENSCLTEDEQYPSVENILKFTKNINFPVPRDFLLQIERDPTEYHKFMDIHEYDAVMVLINHYNLDREVLKDIIMESGLNINVMSLNFCVLQRGKRVDKKFFKKVKDASNVPDRTPLQQNYVDYFSNEYRGKYNVTPPVIGKDLIRQYNFSIPSELDTFADMTVVIISSYGDNNHSTFLLLDNKTKRAQYFDSNITTIAPLYNKLKSIFNQYDLSNPFHESCPIGLQGSGNEIDNYCQTWSIFTQYLYITNHDKPLQEFLGYLLSIGKYAVEILFAYSFYIYTKYKNILVRGVEPVIVRRIQTNIEAMEVCRRNLRKLLKLYSNDEIREYIYLLMKICNVQLKAMLDRINDSTYSAISDTLPIEILKQPTIEEIDYLFTLYNEGGMFDSDQKIQMWQQIMNSLHGKSEYVDDILVESREKVQSSPKFTTCTLF
jgi:hypothetical protein